MHLRTQAHPSPYAHAEAKTVQNCSHPDSRKSTGSFRSPSQSELGWDISLGTQLPNRIPSRLPIASSWSLVLQNRVLEVAIWLQLRSMPRAYQATCSKCLPR